MQKVYYLNKHYLIGLIFVLLSLLLNENYVYIPHEKLEVPDLEEDIKLVKIEEISVDSLKEKLWTLCTSSIALSKNSIENIMELSDYIDVSKDNIESIANE